MVNRDSSASNLSTPALRASAELPHLLPRRERMRRAALRYLAVWAVVAVLALLAQAIAPAVT